VFRQLIACFAKKDALSSVRPTRRRRIKSHRSNVEF
jgi:hypothetical protein